MARNLRPPPRANPELFLGAPRGVQQQAIREHMVGNESTPVKEVRDTEINSHAAPMSTAKSVKDEDPTKISPRGKEIQENPPFEDPLFNQMVEEEMRRIEAELKAELDTQSQLLEGGSISPEGKQLAAHLAGTGQAVDDDDFHPYAPREGINDMRNHSPIGGASPTKYSAAEIPNDPDYNTIMQPPAPASPARTGAGDSPINLKNWKREGYPSEYAYAMAMGELDRRPKQDVKSVAEVGVREEKSWEQVLSPARRKGQRGLTSLQVQQREEKRKAQERYNQQLHEDRLMEERRKQAEAAAEVDQTPKGGFPPPGRGDFDLSGYVNEQARQADNSGVAPSQGVYGVTANTEKQMKREKQEEYRRQLDAELKAVPAPVARRGEKPHDPPEKGLPPQQNLDTETRGAPPSDGFVSSVKLQAAAHQQSFSDNEVEASKAAKRRQQLEYRRALEQQMEEAKAAKERYKAEKEEEDRELLEAAAALRHEPRATDAPGKEASNTNINSFEPSSDNMMVMEYNLAKTRKAPASKSNTNNGQVAPKALNTVTPSSSELQTDNHIASSEDPPPAPEKISGEVHSPGKARQRLISDVYGSSTITAHEIRANPETDNWRPGNENRERKAAAINEQKAMLLKQMEEVRQRKEEEKQKRIREDIEDERRVKQELEQLARQQGVNPMAAPGQNMASPTRRYGNPVGNNSSQMGSQLGNPVMDTTIAGAGEQSEGYNTRGKRLSPDQRAKLQESIQQNYQPLEPLPSKAVQRQRAHQAQARGEVGSSSSYTHQRNFAAPSSAAVPPRQYRSPPRAGLPSGAPSKENPTPGSPRIGGGMEFVHAVQERAMAAPQRTVHYDMPGGDALDAQSSFYSQASRSVYDSFEAVAAPTGNAVHHGVDNFRPTSAEEVDSFLVNWQRQINMPQPRSGFAIPLVPPKQSLHAHQAPLRGSMDSVASKQSYHSQGTNGRHAQQMRASQESISGDVSFVSDSRLIPSNPWDPSGLLAALGPANPITGPGQPSLVEQTQAASALANVGKAALGLDAPKEAGEFYLPSERGKLQASHLTDVGTTAAQMEKSLTSDSLLMYLGSRTPVNPNNLGVDQALHDAHKNPFSVDASQATNPFGSPGGHSHSSASVNAFDDAAKGPESPLTKLVKQHSRPGTAGSTGSGMVRKSPSPPKFKLENDDAEEDEILVIPSPKGSAVKQHTTERTAISPAMQAHSGQASPKAPSPVAFQVHHSPTKSQSSSPEQQQVQEDVKQHTELLDQAVNEEVAYEEDYAAEAYEEDEEEEDGILPSQGGEARGSEAEQTDLAELGPSTGFKKWDPATKDGVYSSEALSGSELMNRDDHDDEGQVVDEEEENMYALDEPSVSMNTEVKISNVTAEAAVTSSAMNYEDDYEDDEDFGDDPPGSFSVKVLVQEGKGIGPAKFVAFDEEGAGPEPFVVLSVANRNYASDRAVGVDPVWQQNIDVDWDGFSLIHVQCMDQNEVDTEVMGDKHLDLSILGLDYGVPMPVELPLDNAYQEGAVMYLEVTLNPPA